MITPAVAPRRTLAQTFGSLRQREQIGLIPFIPAGYPDLTATADALKALDRAGASAIEIGFPFSDPIADGPTIQEAFTAALAKKLRVSDIFKTVREVRPSIASPLVAMLSFSMVFRYGVDRFLHDAKAAGFDAILLPDLPPPEAQSVCGQICEAGLDTVLLIAPTTSPERRQEIAELSTGFIYYLSVSGITGERAQLPPGLTSRVAELRKLTDKPICVGFGIHQRAQVEQLKGVADAAIVGSAYVKRIKQAQGQPGASIASIVDDYTRELLGTKKNESR